MPFHLRALGADGGEVVADAAAAAHGLGGFLQRGVDAGPAVDHLGDRVAHRLHEAVDERGLQRDAGGGVDAAGGDEAFFLRLEEAPLPLRALASRSTWASARATRRRTFDRLLAALGVLLEQGVAADLLLGDGGRKLDFHYWKSIQYLGADGRLGGGLGRLGGLLARRRAARP